MSIAQTQYEQSSILLPQRVQKSTLVHGRDEFVRLRGVTAACLEWASDGEGHILDTVKTAIKDSRMNVIRLPLAAGSLVRQGPGAKGRRQSLSGVGESYRGFLCTGACYIILDLHSSGIPGEWGRQIGQHVMPDQNSLEFWKSFASIYSNHPAVIFDLYNEPHDVTWDILAQTVARSTKRQLAGNPAKSFQAVGMQALLEAIRATGAGTTVVRGGLDWV